MFCVTKIALLLRCPYILEFSVDVSSAWLSIVQWPWLASQIPLHATSSPNLFHRTNAWNGAEAGGLEVATDDLMPYGDYVYDLLEPSFRCWYGRKSRRTTHNVPNGTRSFKVKSQEWASPELLSPVRRLYRSALSFPIPLRLFKPISTGALFPTGPRCTRVRVR